MEEVAIEALTEPIREIDNEESPNRNHATREPPYWEHPPMFTLTATIVQMERMCSHIGGQAQITGQTTITLTEHITHIDNEQTAGNRRSSRGYISWRIQ